MSETETRDALAGWAGDAFEAGVEAIGRVADERDAARAEAARLHRFLARVQSLAGDWAARDDMLHESPNQFERGRAAGYRRAASDVRAVLSPVEPSGEAESGEATAEHETYAYGQSGYDGDACRTCRWQGPPGSAAQHRAETRSPAPVVSGGQADGEGEGRERVVDEGDLLTLPIRSVIAGPAWRSEVYLKAGPDEWYAPAQPDEWTSRTLSHRGPFVVLRLGDEPLTARPVLSREALENIASVIRDARSASTDPRLARQWGRNRTRAADDVLDVLAGEQR